jgi:hypothetical protein
LLGGKLVDAEGVGITRDAPVHEEVVPVGEARRDGRREPRRGNEGGVTLDETLPRARGVDSIR